MVGLRCSKSKSNVETPPCLRWNRVNGLFDRRRPGRAARASQQWGGRSGGGGLVVFRRAGLDRLDDLGRDLLGELGELLGLGAERLEVLAAMRSPQLRRLGGGLHPEQLLGKVERRGGVRLEELHQLGGIFASALARDNTTSMGP